jgi:hypothetical protein
MMIEENYFVEGVMPGMINRDLDPAAHDRYRAPFINIAQRKQINQWPNEVPIGGEPAANSFLPLDGGGSRGARRWRRSRGRAWCRKYRS